MDKLFYAYIKAFSKLEWKCGILWNKENLFDKCLS